MALSHAPSQSFVPAARPGLWAALRMLAHALLPPGVLILSNAAMSGLGLGMPAARLGEGLGLPGWLTFSAFALALTSWGLVRFAVAGRGEAGERAGDWLVVLMAGTIAFPFITLGFDGFWTTLAAFVLTLLACGALVRVAEVSRLAAFAMAPSVVALALPGMFGFSLLAFGWSPPFGVTQAAEPASVPAA